jgi:hypothetical protein
MTDTTTRLYWKYEEGPEDAEGKDPNDVGPVWIDRPDGSSEKANGGEWMTRADARKLAEENGWVLDEDE